MLENLLFFLMSWPVVLTGVALTAWGVHRRACIWVGLGIALTLPFVLLLGLGYHLYLFLLLPVMLASTCLLMNQTPRMRGYAPIFLAAGMLATLEYSASAPQTAWGQALCSQFKPWPSTIDFILMTLLATATLLAPFIVVNAWRQNKSREQSFWLLAMAGMTASQMVQMGCDYGTRAAPWIWRLNAGLSLCCTLAFLIWLAWEWRRNADGMRARKASLWTSAFALFALNFSGILYLLTTG